MAKKLDTGQIEQLKGMVVQGVAPEDISQHFGIAISSVHNYKNRFRQEGIDFPSVKGKRPQGEVTRPAGAAHYRASGVHTPNTSFHTPIGSTQPHIGDDSHRFVVNGVEIHISSDVKSVNIGKNSMEINF